MNLTPVTWLQLGLVITFKELLIAEASKCVCCGSFCGQGKRALTKVKEIDFAVTNNTVSTSCPKKRHGLTTRG